jgi:hypothetical protein
LLTYVAIRICAGTSHTFSRRQAILIFKENKMQYFTVSFASFDFYLKKTGSVLLLCRTTGLLRMRLIRRWWGAVSSQQDSVRQVLE